VISRDIFRSNASAKRLGDVVEFLDARRRPVREDERKPGPFPYYGANGQQGTIDGYPHLAGHFSRVIVSEYSYAQSLVDDLYDPNKPPHIAISVDMLDTGIDVPEIVNLVFFKPVRSKTKFWQMIGRGTRLCPDLFGPGQDKEFFYIFDWCRNFEFFNENPDVTEGAGAETLVKRLFAARVELVGEVDAKPFRRNSDRAL
jgi:type I site-specific restriction endonuclease